MPNNKDDDNESVEELEQPEETSLQESSNKSHIDSSFDEEAFNNRPSVPKRSNFFVDFFTKIENFNKKAFAEKKEAKKTVNKEVKAKKKQLKDSGTKLQITPPSYNTK